MTRVFHALLLLIMLTAAAGCDSDGKSTSTSVGDKKSTAAKPQPKIPGPGEFILDSDLHIALARFNPNYDGRARVGRGRNGEIVDLTIVGTGVSDLSGLTHLRLSVLEASRNPIEDLRPLKDMKLKRLYLANTNVRDLSPLAGQPLEQLWLNDTPVEDIGPLKDMPLVSLTLAGTKVSNLSPLAHSGLERLHIGGTPVSDLSPLEGMRLTRLVFDPQRIEKGLDAVRKITTFNELGLDLNSRMQPDKFWKLYDSGGLSAKR